MIGIVGGVEQAAGAAEFLVAADRLDLGFGAISPVTSKRSQLFAYSRHHAEDARCPGYPLNDRPGSAGQDTNFGVRLVVIEVREVLHTRPRIATARYQPLDASDDGSLELLHAPSLTEAEEDRRRLAALLISMVAAQARMRLLFQTLPWSRPFPSAGLDAAPAALRR